MGHLAQSPLATSGSAMATSLAHALGVVRALRAAKWDLFDGVARLDEDRLEEAQTRLNTLRKALASDEYVENLESHLDEAETSAIRLLAPRVKEDDDDERDGGRKTGERGKVWKSIERGRTTIGPEEWDAEAAKFAALLRDSNGRRRLVLNWSLEREEESP
jgi:hypothetical protein